MKYFRIELGKTHPASKQLCESFAQSLSQQSLALKREHLRRAILGMQRKRSLLGFLEQRGKEILEDPLQFNQAILEFGLSICQRHCFLLWVNELDSLMVTQVFPLFFKTANEEQFRCCDPLFSFGGWRLDERGHLIGVSRQIFHWLRNSKNSEELLCYSQKEGRAGWYLLRQPDRWTADFVCHLSPLLSFECVVDMSPDGDMQIKTQYVVAEDLQFSSYPDMCIAKLPAMGSTHSSAPYEKQELCAALEKQFFEYAYIDYEGFLKLKMVLQQFQQKEVTLESLFLKFSSTVTGRALSERERLKIDAHVLKEKLKKIKAELAQQINQQIAEINPPAAPPEPGMLTQFSETVGWVWEHVASLVELGAYSMDWRP
jgi:hypothetical protein